MSGAKIEDESKLPARRCACGGEGRVIKLYEREDGSAAIRERGCADCGRRWSTSEHRGSLKRLTVWLSD